MRKSISNLLFLSALSALAIGLHLPYPFLPQKPNVILIVLDAARADRFSCYGYGKNTTPRIDAISRRAITFRNHFAQATETIVSASCYLSSRYFTLPILQRDAYRWGVKTETPETIFRVPDPEQILLPEIFSTNGYRTALFSDHSFFTSKTPLTHCFGENFLFHSYDEPCLESKEMTKKAFSEMAAWISGHKNEKFFIYGHFLIPHSPYRIRSEHSKFLKDIAKDFEDSVRKKFKRRKNGSTADWSEKELECFGKLYDHNLNYADHLVGKFYRELKKLRLLDSTVLIITSDHGEDLGDHGFLLHGHSPWDSLIRIPLILHYPPLSRSAAVVNGLTESIDLGPTLADICGLKLPGGKSMDGTSLLKFLGGSAGGKHATLTRKSVRTETQKYISNPELLYDLIHDPHEKNNLAAANPALKQKLLEQDIALKKTYLDRYQKSVRTSFPEEPFLFQPEDFTITPDSLVHRFCDQSMEAEVLSKEETGGKPFLLNLSPEFSKSPFSKLIVLPGIQPRPPLAFSAKIPNGAYQVQLLLKFTEKTGIETLQEFRLQYRFAPKKPFSIPSRVFLYRQAGEEIFYYYFDCGEARVSEESFSVQIRFPSPPKKPFHMIHVKFIPILPQNAETASPPPETPRGNEAFIEKTNELRALGYL